MDKYVGKRLDGRYEIKEVIGVGGMAVVYKAYDNVEDKIVAIKILKEEFSTNEEFLRRFQNESKAIAMMSHPNIVKVNDVSFGDLIQYIVMEYIDGITLKQYIEREGSLPWKDAVHFILQVLRGLQHAHDRGIVHRDIKPQNIMVLQDGTIKVTDFGIARFARSEQKTITDKAIGSVHYISPEQARGEVTDEKSDVYSVGVILYEMLTGQLPFQAENAVSVAIMQLQREPSLPTELNGSIPLGLEQITMHAMQKDAAKRYKSAAEMLCDLDAFRKDPALTFDYAYFVDDSPTKFIGDAEVESEPEEEETEDKVPIIPILAGVAAALVVAAVIVLAIVLGWFNKKEKTYECPNFVGMTYEEVLASDYNDIYHIEYKWEHNTEYPNATVCRQNPDAKNKKLKENAKITVYVSLGTSTVAVPDVSGMGEALALATLRAKGFEPIVVEMPHDRIEAGKVIETSPQATTNLYPGNEVTVYVSTGAGEILVDLPDVVGLNEAEAKSKLAEKGLSCKTENIESTFPEGVVVKQSPSKEVTQKVALGSEVIIYVSTGKVSYEYDLVITLPNDYYSDTGYVSLWINNGKDRFMESDNMITINSYGDYTFKVKTTEKSLPLTVKLKGSNKYDEYMDIVVDSSGEYSIDSYYNYPKKSDSSTPDDTTSSDTNG